LPAFAEAAGISNFVFANFLYPQGSKLFSEPGSSGSLTKGRRGNPREFHLPARKLSLLVPKPLQSRLHVRHCSYTRDFLRD
jgi:hypothetical protein